MSGLVTRSEAARRLGVTERWIGRLVAAGELSQPARGLIDATSVDRHALVARTGKQAWAESTSWAAVALLSGVAPDWIGSTQRSRLRQRLTKLTAEGLVERARDRAKVSRWAAHPSSLARIAAQVVQPDAAGLGLASATRAAVDGYVAADDLDGLVAAHGLIRDEDGPVTLRATTADLQTVRSLARDPVLAALDLSVSLDPRERRAGLTLLESRLDRIADRA